MKTGKLLAALALVLSAGLVHAKLPVPPMDDAAKAKAEETKVKAAEAAKKEAEQLALAQDRVAERYKKGQGKVAEPAAAAKGAEPAAAAKGAKPAVAATGATPAVAAKGATPAVASTKK